MNLTPLRYPGGKAKIYNFVSKVISDNNLSNKIYVEPFSGGFGLGLKLLINGDVNRVIINDYDLHIYAFWYCVFNQTEALINRISETVINIDEWYKQREIYKNADQNSLLDIGFSTLYLNRTNYSGILKGGPIGGLSQRGKYKIDCRFNKNKLISLIEKIAQYSNNVEIYNLDAIDLINVLKPREKELFYNFDPPYVNKAKDLYLNAYNESDHVSLKVAIENIKTEWIMTYDNVELIRSIYSKYPCVEQEFAYTVCSKRKVNELLIHNLNLRLY